MATILSKHFTLEELCQSSKAKEYKISNIPSTQEVANLTALATQVLEPLRMWFGKPVKISSGYRCPRLNKLVGGAANSQHTKGQAADLCIDGDIMKGRKWFEYIRDHLPFDQLLWEYDPKTGTYWIHVSYNPMGNRHQIIDGLEKR